MSHRRNTAYHRLDQGLSPSDNVHYKPDIEAKTRIQDPPSVIIDVKIHQEQHRGCASETEVEAD